jgi:hypothetical protein
MSLYIFQDSSHVGVADTTAVLILVSVVNKKYHGGVTTSSTGFVSNLLNRFYVIDSAITAEIIDDSALYVPMAES